MAAIASTNYTTFHLFVLGTGNLIIKLTVSQGALCQEKEEQGCQSNLSVWCFLRVCSRSVRLRAKWWRRRCWRSWSSVSSWSNTFTSRWVGLQMRSWEEAVAVVSVQTFTLYLCLPPVTVQKLSVDLESLHTVLLSLTTVLTFKKTGKLEDTYWAVMKHFGVTWVCVNFFFFFYPHTEVQLEANFELNRSLSTCMHHYMYWSRCRPTAVLVSLSCMCAHM